MSEPVVTGSFIVWDDVFTAAELDGIEAYGDALLHRKAQIAVEKPDSDAIRITQLAWIEPNAETSAIYDRVAQVVRQLNIQFYHFDINGLENFQYTLYHGSEGGHYDWHLDYGAHNPRPRKISLSIQLSQADSYDGCELHLKTGNMLDIAPKKRGTVIAFPSFFLHRVTPITRGTRKVLVVWAAGPQFR